MDRRSWTVQEDLAIRALVEEFGVLDWTNISQKLKERYDIKQRTGKQCRQRWYNHLNPQVNKKPWTNEEQNLLFEIHRKSGNKWKLMSKYFQGRTDNDIKNHFYSTLRRSLRRLNKFVGQKNSTTQMRQIKPSVLSTIMNYIYEQENTLESNIVSSLKDLPYLIFEFSNFKPVKNKLKVEEDENIKAKINFIFMLINSANSTYQNLKSAARNQKLKKHQPAVWLEDQYIKRQKPEEIDLFKYLPKKVYSFSDPAEIQAMARKSKEKTTKTFKKNEYSEVKVEEYQKYERDLLNTDLIQEEGNHHDPEFLIRKEYEERDFAYNPQLSHKKDQHPMMDQTGHLRTRRISLQAHEEFMEEEIGDLDQPSQISGFHYNGTGLDDLVVVGRQIAIHRGEQSQVKIEEPHSSNQNIDQLIQINYSH